MFNYYNIVFNLYDLIHEGINIINTYDFRETPNSCEASVKRKIEIASIVLEYEDELIQLLIEKFKYYFIYRYIYGCESFWHAAYI
jgi:hypothetical protein